jgi:hypothetical protein
VGDVFREAPDAPSRRLALAGLLLALGVLAGLLAG